MGVQKDTFWVAYSERAGDRTGIYSEWESRQRRLCVASKAQGQSVPHNGSGWYT